MTALAKPRHPQATFVVDGMCTWPLPRQYDVIAGWDSTVHFPLDRHEPVLRQLCEGLSKGCVLLLTCGGAAADERSQGEFGGTRFEYSSLGVPEFARLLWGFGCAIRHLEYDQYTENHVYLIAAIL